MFGEWRETSEGDLMNLLSVAFIVDCGLCGQCFVFVFFFDCQLNQVADLLWNSKTGRKMLPKIKFELAKMDE